MPVQPRPRRLARAALTVALLALVAACAGDQPNSIFHSHTEFNREVGHLFSILIWLGTAVFVIVEGILVYTLFRFRHRAGENREPEQVHGNTRLEITWTVIPAVILVFIAIPTVRTIFSTQAKARADALQVEVIGHQWWWEFRYPQYNVVTANELYLPLGRTVNFTLHTQDVLHSFWIPQLGGKRDLIANHTNYLWFTPDSLNSESLNGFCAEYCGTSHGNMRFRVYTVSQADFTSWAAHQAQNATFTVPAPGQAVANTQAAVAQNPALAQPVKAPNAKVNPSANLKGGGAGESGVTTPSSGPSTSGVPVTGAAPTQVAQAGFVTFPADQMQHASIPQTPTPAGLTFDESLLAKGDPARGADLLSKGTGACLGCHTIKGNPMMVGQVGPNLTHIALRHTIAAGLYPNDAKHLALWIKNARMMKPGVIMPTLGLNQYDPILKRAMTMGGLTDAQIADIVAYLQALK